MNKKIYNKPEMIIVRAEQPHFLLAGSSSGPTADYMSNPDIGDDDDE